MTVFPIPAFADNYLWLLIEGDEAVVVDPGEAAPVERELAARGLRLTAILVTHWHPDHIGGVTALRKNWDVPVYGPTAEAARIPTLTHLLREGDALTVLGQRFVVWETPGHTLGHIVYVGDGRLFCGDTLFSAGCGRLFEGTPEQMHASLQRLTQLRDDTQVFCTHEYTLSNLAYARTVEPQNAALLDYSARCEALRAKGQPTLPSTIGLERAINPFLRAASAEQFAQRRREKDQFKA